MKKISLISFFLFLLFFYLNTKYGYKVISNQDIIDFFIGNLTDDSKKTILELRVFKIFSAILVGISLPISGFLLQELFKNPLAGPSVLGISSSSSLAVALFIFLGLDLLFINNDFLSEWILAIFSILGSILCLLILLLLIKKVHTSSSFILVGFLFSAFTGSIISILEYYSQNEQIKNYLVWSLGSFSGLSFDQLVIFCFLVILGLIFSFKSIHLLKGLMLGEEYAISMGINKFKMNFYIIIATSLFVGASTAFVGPISFIGIIVPHFCRSIYKPSKLWKQFILNAIIGSVLMLIFLFISEQFKLPINIITVLIGIPTIFMIIFNKKNSFI